MKLHRSVRLAALALCLPLATTSTGCAAVKTLVLGGEVKFHCPQHAAPGLAIAVGARANSPTPAPPAEVRQLIVDAMKGCGKITVIRVDGRPGVAGEPVFSTGAKTKQNLDIDQDNFLKDIDALLAEGAKARVAEANVLQALSVASDAAGKGGTVVVIDSGVQTTAPLDFRENNLSSQRPAAIVKALKKQGLLPDLTGRKVIMAGLGYTAMPQEPLDEKNQAFLVELWREIVTASGVKDPVVAEEPNTSKPAVTSPPVSVVRFPVADIKLGCDTLSVLPDTGAVGFVPDQAEFRDPGAASKVLGRFASFLRETPTAKVLIEGYVAHYGTGDLSQRRADRVKQELSTQGVTNPIAAKGMGWGPYPSASAPPDPRYDQKNRRVVIEVSCARPL